MRPASRALACLLLAGAGGAGDSGKAERPATPMPADDPCVYRLLGEQASTVELSFAWGEGDKGAEACEALSFPVNRETVGSPEEVTESQLRPNEVDKCQRKGKCTYGDKVAPGESYVYYIRAASLGGTSEPAEIRCDVPTLDYAVCVGDEGAAAAAADDSAGGEMSVGSALFLGLGCLVLGGALTAFFMFRSAWIFEQMRRRDEDRMDPKWVHLLARWLPLGCLLLVHVAWFWSVAGPIEDKLVPKLEKMIATSRNFRGQIADIDHDGNGVVSLAEFQHDAQVAIVAESVEAFEESEKAWIKKINQLQLNLRVDADELLDGDPVMQPGLVAMFIICCVLFTYAAGMACASHELWAAERGQEETSLQRLLEPKTEPLKAVLFRPGYYIAIPMLPMVGHQLWLAYQVLSAAMLVAGQMRQNVKSLNKIQAKLAELGKSKEVYKLEDTVGMFTQPEPGKRWGVKMCGYAIDDTFWSSFRLNLLLALLCLVVLFPLIVMARANRKKELEREASERERAKAKEREEKEAALRKAEEAKSQQAEQARLEVNHDRLCTSFGFGLPSFQNSLAYPCRDSQRG